METIEHYVCLETDQDGLDGVHFTNFAEADEYAIKHRLMVIAITYTFADSNLIFDYTEKDAEHDEAHQSQG